MPDYKSWIPTGEPARALTLLPFPERKLVARVALALAEAFDWPCEVGDDGHTIFKYFSSVNFAGAAAGGLPVWLLAPGDSTKSLSTLWFKFAENLAGL